MFTSICTAILVIYAMICAIIVPVKYSSYKKEKNEFAAKQKELHEKQMAHNAMVEKLKYDIAVHEQEVKVFADKEMRFEQTRKAYNNLYVQYKSLKNDFSELEDKCNDRKKELLSYEAKIDEYNAETSAQKQKMEQAWNDQIESGNLPENITLRAENRASFFIYMIPLDTTDSVQEVFISEPFGNAKDAKMFADSLREIFEANIFVRQTENYGEYQVWAENLNTFKIEQFYQRQNQKYEFMNPCFDKSAENYHVISDEKKILTALPSSESCESGEDYEKYVASKLSASGFRNVRLTPTTGDYGADVLCEKQGIKYCVQCKFYSNPVGVGAVQEIFAAKAHYDCARAMVITNNIFTPQARKLAGDNGVVLVDNFT